MNHALQKEGVAVELVLLPRLQQSIDATDAGNMTLLQTERGQPFASAASFGNWFRDRCDEAGVTKSAHGIRKFNAVLVAERGATTSEMMALFGWQSDNMPTLYSKSASRLRLAKSVSHTLDRK